MRRLITGNISSRLFFAGQFLLALFSIGNLIKGKSSRGRGNKTCREETTLRPRRRESPTLPSTIVLLLAYLGDSNPNNSIIHDDAWRDFGDERLPRPSAASQRANICTTTASFPSSPSFSDSFLGNNATSLPPLSSLDYFRLSII